MTVLHYDLDDELHRRVKVLAAERGITIKQLLVDVLELVTEDPKLLDDRRR